MNELKENFSRLYFSQKSKLEESYQLFKKYLENTPKDVLKNQADKWNEIDNRIKQNRKMIYLDKVPQIILVMGSANSEFRELVDNAKERFSANERITIIAPEIIYRHPKAIIQFVRDIVSIKLPCLIITYSDYVVKEINNLVMLGYNEQILGGLTFESDGFSYLPKHVLPKDELKPYIYYEGYFDEIEVNEYGIVESAFDAEIESINKTSDKLVQQMIVKDDSNNSNT
jgi:hypothetical protein